LGWVGGGGAALLGAETGPADIAIAAGGKWLTTAVGTYAGQKTGQLLGSIFCSSGTGREPGTGSAGEEKPTAQLKKLSPSEIRKLEAEGGAHQIKGEALGTNKAISQYDLYKDTSGNIYVAAKGGIGEAIPTGLNVYHF
jgi:hypothetical protein